MRKTDRKFTLDELLSAKREEKPSPEFWTKFEQELKRKERLTLQTQPVDESLTQSTFGSRFKLFSAVCCAAASCGVLGFVAIQHYSASPEAKVVALQEDPARAIQNVPTVMEQPVFEVAEYVDEAPAYIPAREVVRERAVVESPVTLASSVAPQQAQMVPVATLDESITVVPETNYTLEIETPFEGFDPSQMIAFSGDQGVTDSLMRKYQHPLSDLGFKYDTVAVSFPGQSKSVRRALHESVLSSSLPADLDSDWDAITLRF